jgi:hypothetical protein
MLLYSVGNDDSKGRYLREHIQSPVENQIKWQCKSGRTTYESYNWLLQNIDHQIGQHDNIHFYIWLATCDLTSYNPPFIYLALICDRSLFSNFLNSESV